MKFILAIIIAFTIYRVYSILSEHAQRKNRDEDRPGNKYIKRRF
jgi:hypothetical protein